MRIWIKHYKRNKFQFVPGYREQPENNHFDFVPSQNQHQQQQGRRNSTKKRKNSKSQDHNNQPQAQTGGGRQRKQSTQQAQGKTDYRVVA